LEGGGVGARFLKGVGKERGRSKKGTIVEHGVRKGTLKEELRGENGGLKMAKQLKGGDLPA